MGGKAEDETGIITRKAKQKFVSPLDHLAFGENERLVSGPEDA